MDEQVKDFGDYLSAIRRYKKGMLATGISVLIISLLIAIIWPPTYKSSAKVLIESQEIPNELVRTTVTSAAFERVQKIAARAMSSLVLWELIEKHGLYQEYRERETKEEILSRMRESLALEPDVQDILDPRTGRPIQAMIAFTLSYQSDNPVHAQKVTSEMIEIFREENLKQRTEQSRGASAFLTEEAEKLQQQIQKLEAELSVFKKKYPHSLPELRDLNMRGLERTEAELASTEEKLRSLYAREVDLKGELAQTNPVGIAFSATGQRVLDPKTRLKALRTEYMGYIAKYSDTHPDVVRVRREIKGLEEELGISTDFSEQAKKLSQLRGELAEVRKNYNEDHPDIKTLQNQITSLENDILSADVPAKTEEKNVKPDNPAYISLDTQLKNVQSNINSLAEQKQRLKDKLAEYEQRLTETPEVEKQYQEIARAHQQASRRYQEIHARQLEADIAKELEQERKGERFELVEPAQIPEKPISPNRPAIVFLGLVLSIASSFGYMVIRETLDSSIRGDKAIQRITGILPLATVPYISDSIEKTQQKQIQWALIGSIAGIIVVGITFIHFVIAPLDVMWFRIMRKISIFLGL